MITLAVVAMAACTQAASLNWMIAGTQAYGEDTSASGYATYLFLTATGGDYGAGTVTSAELNAALESASTFATFVSENAAVSKALNQAGGATGATGFNGNNFGAGDSLSAVVVIVDAANAADATAYMVTAEKSVTWTSATGAQTLQFGTQAANTWNAFPTSNVPEPTSGLLLLLGMAGLALRRKQA